LPGRCLLPADGLNEPRIILVPRELGPVTSCLLSAR